MPCSAASLRTNGDNSRPPAPSRVTGAATVSAVTARGLAASAGLLPLPLPADPTTFEPGAPMRASTVPTGTVSPALTRMSSIVPSYGLGISESTLSVDTSNSGSSNATSSPTALNHVPIVPSVTDSPSFGMVISKTSPVPDGEKSAFSVVGPSDPPTDGAEGSLSDRPPAAATPCAAEGSRFCYRGALPADPHDRSADRDGVALLRQDLKDHTVVRAGDLRIDLVGRYFEQRVVEFDFVADVS